MRNIDFRMDDDDSSYDSDDDKFKEKYKKFYWDKINKPIPTYMMKMINYKKKRKNPNNIFRPLPSAGGLSTN
jgi:hypothetical protein